MKARRAALFLITLISLFSSKVIGQPIDPQKLTIGLTMVYEGIIPISSEGDKSIDERYNVLPSNDQLYSTNGASSIGTDIEYRASKSVGIRSGVILRNHAFEYGVMTRNSTGNQMINPYGSANIIYKQSTTYIEIPLTFVLYKEHKSSSIGIGLGVSVMFLAKEDQSSEMYYQGSNLPAPDTNNYSSLSIPTENTKSSIYASFNYTYRIHNRVKITAEPMIRFIRISEEMPITGTQIIHASIGLRFGIAFALK